MTIAVRFYSKTGNTKRIADAIAEAAGVQALPITSDISEPVDLLFLGGAFYFMHPAKELREYIEKLDPDKVKKVACFSTSGGPEDAAREIAHECEKRGLHVLKEDFHCTSHKAKEAEGLEAAAAFAKQAIIEAQG